VPLPLALIHLSARGTFPEPAGARGATIGFRQRYLAMNAHAWASENVSVWPASFQFWNHRRFQDQPVVVRA
jgi:hypothetical protein